MLRDEVAAVGKQTMDMWNLNRPERSIVCLQIVSGRLSPLLPLSILYGRASCAHEFIIDRTLMAGPNDLNVSTARSTPCACRGMGLSVRIKTGSTRL